MSWYTCEHTHALRRENRGPRNQGLKRIEIKEGREWNRKRKERGRRHKGVRGGQKRERTHFMLLFLLYSEFLYSFVNCPVTPDIMLVVNISANHTLVRGWHLFQTWHITLASYSSQPTVMSRGGGDSGAVFKSHKAARFDSVGRFPANFCGDETWRPTGRLSHTIFCSPCPCGFSAGPQTHRRDQRRIENLTWTNVK